jgi:Domain of Unknown Function (DUF349)
MDLPERQIGVVKESEEASLLYFVKRFELAKTKVETLQQSIVAATNKGSYLMKLIHMRTYLADFDGLGEFPIYFRILDDLEDEILQYIAVNRQKNFELKQAMLQEAESLQDTSSWSIASKKFKEIKIRWIKTGAAYKEHEDEFNRRFENALNRFYERRKVYQDERNRVVNDRVDKYQAIVDKLHWINEENPSDAFPQVKSMQSEWRTVGKIPKKRFITVFKDFKAELEVFYGKGKRKTDVTRISVSKNPIDQKRDYCEFVEKWLENDQEAPIDQIKEIQNQWKKLGKLKHILDREYNTRFKIACNEIFESHFLTRAAKKQTPDFDSKNRFEQIKIKIRMLKDAIKKDENDLSLLNDQAAKKKNLDPTANMEKLNQINKLKTKNRILRKLQDLLLSNY